MCNRKKLVRWPMLIFCFFQPRTYTVCTYHQVKNWELGISFWKFKFDPISLNAFKAFMKQWGLSVWHLMHRVLSTIHMLLYMLSNIKWCSQIASNFHYRRWHCLLHLFANGDRLNSDIVTKTTTAITKTIIGR